MGPFRLSLDILTGLRIPCQAFSWLGYERFHLRSGEGSYVSLSSEPRTKFVCIWGGWK